ncbi:MAG: ribonuclease HI [Pseudomonadales bacterium]
MATIMVYTDGACPNNGEASAQGGYGALLINAQGKRLEIAGPLSGHHQTNNRAELTAVIEGLAALKQPSTVILTTDSQYVRKGCNEWLTKWKSNGWKTASRKPVANDDLWRQLDALLTIHTVEVRWVKGHSGQPENERADALATLGATGQSVRRYTRVKQAIA